jgi:hypothetical protein
MRSDRKLKKPIPKKKEVNFGFDSQMELFLWLWNEAKDQDCDVYCKYTGEKLNRFYRTNTFWNCFAHILPKFTYRYFKLNPSNVRVVYPTFHRIVDQGTLEERKQHPEWKWDLWDSEVLEMKREYQRFKKENLLA